MSQSKLYPELLDVPNNILNLDKYNGRVNILETPSPDAIFQMQERIAIKNSASPYGEALKGTWEDNVLAQVYFSAENIQIIQNGIRANVYQRSGGKINVPNQNIDNLKIVMRGVYIEYAEHYPKDIKGQVERLNKLVLDYAVPNVYSEAVAYFKYIVDQSTLAVPLELPLASDRNYKSLEFRPFVEYRDAPVKQADHCY
jgi:hypothetical protein